eukprot:TRINITY_DN30407_c0_g2_i1.p1 TRINITY_DN30407_c0_g2~~TRINITY_DN30407_c0_g2_i1.p1  ORF type:complete len:249 (-),score=28.02 TRINITY_DN30407_c0_g2_i1:54-800(-)
METKECALPFVPAQEGPATEHSHTIRHWMILILVLQAAACVVRGVFLQDLVGCCWCAAVCLLGFYAVAQTSHIGNIVFWGCACCVNALFDIISFGVLAGVGMIDLDPAPTAVRAAIPFTQLLGALYAWHLWRDYKISKGSEPWHDFDPLARACNWPLYEKYQSKFQARAEEPAGPFDEDADDTKSLRSNRSYKTFYGGHSRLEAGVFDDPETKARREKSLRAEYGTFITRDTGKMEDQWTKNNCGADC